MLLLTPRSHKPSCKLPPYTGRRLTICLIISLENSHSICLHKPYHFLEIVIETVASSISLIINFLMEIYYHGDRISFLPAISGIIMSRRVLAILMQSKSKVCTGCQSPHRTCYRTRKRGALGPGLRRLGALC